MFISRKHAYIVLTITHNLFFEQINTKFQSFLSEKFHFLVVKFSVHLNRRVFVINFLIDLKISRNKNLLEKQKFMLVFYFSRVTALSYKITCATSEHSHLHICDQWTLSSAHVRPVNTLICTCATSELICTCWSVFVVCLKTILIYFYL